MDNRNHERFGRYEILAELGRGAMGVVYKARDPKINRDVAIKTISMAGQSPDDEQEFRGRFFREAEAAGRISHPGIVTIFDVGEEPDTRSPYIVMEFVGGDSLEKRLSEDNNKLPLDKALQLTIELAEALDCAHAQGVVHRDLKPSNILLTEDGHAKIADFGVAKLNLANHTLAGRALGTPAYMSPEQLNGDPVDGRSDLFSLGVVLYTVLTGHRPFQGNSAITVSFKVVNREPLPATVLAADLPPGLDYIIDRAMAKDPNERYQRGSELVQDIQSLREGREPASQSKLPLWLTSRGDRKNATRQNESVEATQSVVINKPQPGIKILPPKKKQQPAALLETIRKHSVAAVLVLAGIFIVGIWVISFGPQGVRPKAAAPASHAEVADTIKTPPTSEPAANPVDSPAVTPKRAAPVVKTSPKTQDDRPHRAVPNPVKVSRAIPPAITPAISVAAPAPPAPEVPPATLEIEVEHKFAQANLSIWVDDRLTYTRVLEGTDKKHLVVFHHVQGHEFHALQVTPGKHRLRVQVSSDATLYNQSAAVQGEFASGHEQVLLINFNKQGDMVLSLQ
jgi:eukaryotic-like serine/threonine-protein kinase